MAKLTILKHKMADLSQSIPRFQPKLENSKKWVQQIILALFYNSKFTKNKIKRNRPNQNMTLSKYQ